MKTSLLPILILALVLGFFAGAHAQQAVLRAGDQIEMRITGVPDFEISQFSTSQTIDESGCLNITYIGKVQVAGMTTSGAQSHIESRLRSEQIFKHPTIILTMQSHVRMITVVGEVKMSGSKPWRANMKVMDAIGDAGGFTDFADRKKVKLVRNNRVIDLDTTKFSKDPSLDVKVLPGDQIVVKQKGLF